MVVAVSEDSDLDDLKRQTSQGDRIDEMASKEEQRGLSDDIIAELEAIDAGEQQKTVSVWDGHLAAFVRALERNPEQLNDVGHALQRNLDLDEGDIDRSEVLRLALRLGFQEAAPDQFEAVLEAACNHATKGL